MKVVTLSRWASTVVTIVLTIEYARGRAQAELLNTWATTWDDSMADLSAAPNATLEHTTVFHL